MSTIALVMRIQNDKLAITTAFRQGRLGEVKARSLAHVPVDVVDYTRTDPELTDDEHEILRNTLEFWMKKARHEVYITGEKR